MWYYAEGSDRHGPLEASDIDALIAEGTITADTLVWKEGMAGWEATSEHFQMSPRRPAPPPTPLVPPVLPSSTQPNPDMTPDTQRVRQDAPGGDTGPDGLYVHAPSRSFGEAISACFSKFVTFKGRASRSEYWFFILFTVLLGIVASILDAVLFPGQIDVAPINSIVSLALFLPTLSASVRRLHDTNRSGWWIGGFYLAMLAFGIIVGVVIATSADFTTPEPDGAFIALFGLGGIALVIYAIVVLVFTIQKGTLGPNRFG